MFDVKQSVCMQFGYAVKPVLAVLLFMLFNKLSYFSYLIALCENIIFIVISLELLVHQQSD
jgi:ABC-type microcin C transport system permease subunit YejB